MMASKADTLQEEIHAVKSKKATKLVLRKSKKRIEPVDWNQELNWFKKNRWVFEKHKGEWVAVKGNQLVAHGPDYGSVVTFCRENDIENPLVQYLPKTEQEWNIGLGNYVIPEDSYKNPSQN